MELKSYQENVLTELELYLKILSQKKQDQFDYYNFQKKIKKNHSIQMKANIVAMPGKK